MHHSYRVKNIQKYLTRSKELTPTTPATTMPPVKALSPIERMEAIFTKFEPGKAPDQELEREFFQKRARRKYLCDICLWFAIGVLVFSAFITFGT